MYFVKLYFHIHFSWGIISLFLKFLSFWHFLGRFCGMWRFPGWRSNWSCSCWPTPEPQQLGIQASSATYTTAHGNARSLTHWARPGIELVTSWFLVGFVNHWATMGTPGFSLKWWKYLRTWQRWWLHNVWCAKCH